MNTLTREDYAAAASACSDHIREMRRTLALLGERCPIARRHDILVRIDDEKSRWARFHHAALRAEWEEISHGRDPESAVLPACNTAAASLLPLSSGEH